MDPDSEKPDGARLSQAEIETQVRDLYGAKLDACARFHAFGEGALYSWEGRGIDPQSVDPIIVVEAARQTKTYGGALRLAAGGFGPQASMLARSLFEGMAIAHWAHANPELALERFKKHARHSQLLWGDALEKAEPADPREIDTGSDAERKELAALFAPYGTHLWTGHGSLHALMPDIEEEWLEGEPRKMLWWFFRIPQRDNNQVLHTTSLGLSGVASLTTEALGLDAGPSDYYLDRGLLGATWCYAQMMTLLWDHFAIPDRASLDEVVDGAGRPFGGWTR